MQVHVSGLVFVCLFSGHVFCRILDLNGERSMLRNMTEWLKSRVSDRYIAALVALAISLVVAALGAMMSCLMYMLVLSACVFAISTAILKREKLDPGSKYSQGKLCWIRAAAFVEMIFIIVLIVFFRNVVWARFFHGMYWVALVTLLGALAIVSYVFFLMRKSQEESKILLFSILAVTLILMIVLTALET